MKKFLKIFLTIILIPIILFCVFLIYAIIDNYKPKEIEVVYSTNGASKLYKDTINVMLWNIGYCGMDATIDFFYDGGTQARVSQEQTLQNLQDITNVLLSNSNYLDFILLQEVDICAKRSYKINQYDSLNKKLADFKAYFG